jgi:Transposase DDE domain
MKVTKQKYGQFLVNSPVNFTGTYFADTVEGLEHDSVHRFLKDNKLTPALLREKVSEVIEYSPIGRILFDDSVMDKYGSQVIEGAVKQYSGNAHHPVMGIGVVTCVYYNPDNGLFYPLDFRQYDIARDGKTKLDHVMDMMKEIIRKAVPFTHFLMDSWYAVTEILNQIMDWGKLFVCAIKSNRLFSPDQVDERGKHVRKPVKDLDWSGDAATVGYHGRLKGLPVARLLKLFRIVVGSDKTEYIVTNDVSIMTTDDARAESAIRWKIEEFHRELKQTTGIERCQARKNRSQRNHIVMCMLAWLQMKVTAWATNRTIYEVKQDPLRDYVATQWRNPATIFSLC